MAFGKLEEAISNEKDCCFSVRISTIKVFYVPNGIVSIAAYAFYDVNRATATIALPSTLQSIGNHAFEYSSVSVVPVNEVNRLVGKNYYTIMLPQSVNSIGEFSFAHCMGTSWERYRVLLEESSLVDIPNQAFFMSCLEKVTLPQTLETIGKSAFEAKATGTSTLIVPRNVKRLNDRAFYGISFIIEFEEDSLLSEIGKGFSLVALSLIMKN